MQTTSNYSLNLVEGTDLVNPPIQFNPNFQTIDSAMFANKEASIGTASEVVTGSVHAIVRANQDADVFRFTATGAWTTGDTMTVDGVSVTVHLSDGTAPLTGAYVIGAEVVAVINGTLVTLLTSTKSIDPGVTSFNSRTGAVTPQTSDYDASMVDYDNTASGLTSTDLQGAVDELSENADWEYIGTATSSTPVPISYSTGTYRVVALVSGANAGFIYEIPANILSSTEMGFQNGASFTTSSYFGISIGASNVAIRCVQYYGGGVNHTADVTIHVYHKKEKYI